ncbi:hypothetical protein DER45DRAFT_138842 [Fusarium avenaceum]|nr:hypothetical protein DER45DRAFT_138842 [Fusarium avenaceum]
MSSTVPLRPGRVFSPTTLFSTWVFFEGQFFWGVCLSDPAHGILIRRPFDNTVQQHASSALCCSCACVLAWTWTWTWTGAWLPTLTTLSSASPPAPAASFLLSNLQHTVGKDE